MTPKEPDRDFFNSPEAKGSMGRAQVRKLAAHSPLEALVVARGIQHPWYRCQALTILVEANLKHPTAEALLEEACLAAYSQAEPNRVAAVLSWPLRLLALLNPKAASNHTEKALNLIAQEPHSLRRLHGLAAILRSVFLIKPLRERVLASFTATANASFGWRADRIVGGIARALGPFDWSAAMQLLTSRPESRFSRRALRELSSQGKNPDNGT
jgi:hypothetical protein